MQMAATSVELGSCVPLNQQLLLLTLLLLTLLKLLLLSHLNGDDHPAAALRYYHGLQHCAQALRVTLELAESGAAILAASWAGNRVAADQVVDEGRLSQTTLACRAQQMQIR
jgi:hypothetical protein